MVYLVDVEEEAESGRRLFTEGVVPREKVSRSLHGMT